MTVNRPANSSSESFAQLKVTFQPLVETNIDAHIGHSMTV